MNSIVDDASRASVEDGVLSPELEGKLNKLRSVIAETRRLAVAFSGGVDSTLLLAVAHEVLGDDVLAVTGKSASVPMREIEEAQAFCAERDIRHRVVETHEFELPGFDHNPPDRCYFCKREIFTCLSRAAAEEGVQFIAEGSNLDDEGDYRPGFKAVEEMGALSPLREAGLYKKDVRALAKHLGLKVWNKPAFACLNSRFAYGDLITPERLGMVDRAEEAIRSMGFEQVRVRLQGDTSFTARIEVVPDDIERLASEAVRSRVVEACKDAGFAYVALDLQGYRTGSMNETL